MKKLIIPLMLVLLLSACGFHLRGMIDVPKWLNNVAFITKNDDKQFLSLLKAQLEGYSIQVNPDPGLAQYWLIINQIDLQQQIVSVGASTNPRQYILTLTVEFMLQTRKGEVIKPTRKIIVSRQLTVNNDRILGSNDEERILVGEMKRDAVMQMINLLSHNPT
ncbi:MAG: LPS assembly lipoprotein LptE [Legionella sp.]|nr:LPS assembly lipoprotein LptE [Legionella sp.]